jgi:hypothetical protein
MIILIIIIVIIIIIIIIQKSLPLVPILNQINPVHTLAPKFK